MYDDIIDKLLNISQQTRDSIFKRKCGNYKEIKVYDVFLAICLYGKNAASILGIVPESYSNNLRRLFGDLPTKYMWHTYVLSCIGYKRCNNCKTIKILSEYNKGGQSDGTSGFCKPCLSKNRDKDYFDKYNKVYYSNNKEYFKKHNKQWSNKNKAHKLFLNANRRSAQLNALPSWADLDKIKLIYKLRPKDYHIDHIVPLINDIVCGLHIENNLQYLLSKDNLIKSNKFEISLSLLQKPFLYKEKDYK